MLSDCLIWNLLFYTMHFFFLCVSFRFSFFHLEYQPTTGRGLTNLLAKHYRNQALFQLHTIIFGLDALGNPVSVVRGVVGGAVDLFYEPIKVINILTLHVVTIIIFVLIAQIGKCAWT